MKKFLWLTVFVAICCEGYENFTEAYQDGIRHFRAKKFVQSIKMQQQALALSSNPAQVYSARINISENLFQLKKYDDASKVLQDLLISDGISPSMKAHCHLNLGKIAYKRKKYKTAIGHYQTSLDNCSNWWGHSIALLMLANCHYQLKQYDMVEKFVRQIVDLKQNYADDAWKLLLSAKLAVKDYVGAEKVCEEFEKYARSQNKPYSLTRALSSWAHYWMSSHNYVKAIEVNQKIVKLPADQATPAQVDEARNRLMDCYLALKEYNKAKAILEQTVNPTPWRKKLVLERFNNQDYYWYIEAANKLFENGKYEEAVEKYLACVDFTQESRLKFIALRQIIYCALRSSDYDLAQEIIPKILIIKDLSNPQLAETYRAVAEVFEATGNYEKAILYAQKSLTLNKKGWGYYWSLIALGRFYSKIEKYSLAEHYLNKVIQDRDANCNDIFNALSILAQNNVKLHNLRNADENLLVCKKLLKRSDAPKDLAVKISYLEAQCWMMLKKYPRAIRCCRQIESSPQAKEYWLKKSRELLIICYCRLKDFRKAQKLVKEYPNISKWLIDYVEHGYENQDYNKCMERGKGYMRERKFLSALNMFKEAEENANNSTLLFGAKIAMAEVSTSLKNYSQTHDICESILKLKDIKPAQLSYCYRVMANAANNQSNSKLAIKYLEQSISTYDKGSTYYSSLIALAELYWKRKDKVFAEEFLQKVFDNPKAPASQKIEAWLKKASFKAHSGDEKEAVECIYKSKILLTEISDSVERNLYAIKIKNNLALCWHYLDKNHRAIELFKEVRTMRGASFDVINNAENMEVYCHYKLKHYKKAKRMLDDLKYPYPWIKRAVNQAYWKYGR